MRNIYKFLLVFISLALVGGGVFSQIDNAKLKLQNQKEKQDNPVNQVEERIAIPVVWTPKDGAPGNQDGTDSFCAPTFSTGCSVGDGITDFAVEELENYNNGCADLNGTGWSEYYYLTPAVLIPGNVHTFNVGTGFSNQYLNIWIDFNDDDNLTADELVLVDYSMAASGILYDVEVIIPANATPGEHAMRAMAVYASTFTDPCGSYTYGEAEDYMVFIVTPVYGDLEGVVTEDLSGNPIEGAFVSLNNGLFTATTDATGFYAISDVLGGTWTAVVSKDNYWPDTLDVTIEEGEITTQDFQIVAPGSIEGYVKEFTSGNIIEGAAINIDNGTYTTISDASGYYSFDEILTGTWDVSVVVEGYNPLTISIIIEEGILLVQDLLMTNPTMDISPGEVNVVVDPNAQLTEYLDIANNGDGLLSWSAQIEFLTDSKIVNPVNPGISKDIIASEEASKEEVIASGTPVPVDQLENKNIPLKSSYKELMEQTDETEIIGSDVNGYNAGPRSRGNIFSCTTEKLLIEFMGYHDVTINPTQMWMLVYEGETQEGDYDLVVASDVSPAALGLGWVSSGDVNYMLQPGKYYIMCASFEQACGYYNAQGVTPFPYPVAFGEAIGGAGWNWSPTSVFPPDQTQTVTAIAFGEPTVYYQQLVTSDPEFWLMIDPSSDDIDPGNAGQMALNFDATDIVPGTVKTANIHFTSNPDVGSVTIPVSMTVGNLAFGHVVGNVFLDGTAPYNIGEITEVLVEAGPYFTNPDANGDYDITAYPGTYDVTATLYGYEQQSTSAIVVDEGATVSGIDFMLPCINGRLLGTVTDEDTGDPIENAIISIIDTEMEVLTAVDGTYEIFVEGGTYNIQADHPTYAVEVASNIALDIQMDTQLDFELMFQCVFCDASGGGDEYLNGVEFGNISNLNSGYQTGYVNYTSLSTLVIPGFSYPITIHTGNMYASDDYGVWVDWNMDCTFDPISENVVCGIDMGADINTWDIPIPPNALPGLVTMRVRLKFSPSDCGDPCGTTTYGEVEDYSIIIVPGTYGSLSGVVTELSTGNPIEGGIVNMAGFYSDTTEADGSYYFEEVITGSWDLSCSKVGYNIVTGMNVVIEEDQMTVADISMTAPIIEITPDAITITLEPNQQTNESILIENTGDGPVDWEAFLNFPNKSGDEVGDIVFELAIGNITGETQTYGSEWDGQYLWTTGGASFADPNQLYKFDLDGNLVAQFDQPLDGSSSGIRDLAFDGTYLYGGNEVAFYMIDPSDGTVTQLFENNFGQTITALAWVPVFDAFYSKNQGSDLIKFDMVGNLQESFTVAGATNVTGAAWDNLNNKLWLFNQSGSPQSTFLEYDIVANELTGITHQVETVGGSSSQVSVGAFFATDMIPGLVVLGGSTQGIPNMAFAMEIGSSANWISFDLQSGTLSPGGDVSIGVAIDATDLLPAVYEASISFTTDPFIDGIIVPVELTVEGLIPPVALFAYYSCTDVFLSWEIPGGTPDGYNIYRNGDLLTTVTTVEYSDMMVDPMVDYCYSVTAVYGSEESQPSAESCLTVPLPENLGIYFIEGWGSSDTAYIVWDNPEACVMANEFNIYRDNAMIGSTVDTFYYDVNLASAFYQYYVTAVYYFGESEYSEIVPILIVSLDENKLEGLVVSPNPAIDYVMVNSGIHVNNYTIIDVHGKIIQSNIVESSNFTIDVSHYNEGLYYLKFEADTKIILRKIILK